MPKVAVVLYSYTGRRDRQRMLAGLCYEAVSRIPNAAVFVTTGPNDAAPPAACYRPLPLDVPTGYEYLPDKTLAMLRWFAAQDQYDYLLKCDDDLVLDPAAVRKLIASPNHHHYQAGLIHFKSESPDAYTYHKGKCRDAILNEIDTDVSWAPQDFMFAAGTCYLISQFAARSAISIADRSGFDPKEARRCRDNRGIGAEDWMTGSLLRDSGICPELTFRVMFCSNWFMMLRQFRGELASRLTRRQSLRRCMGIVTSNRTPTMWERIQILSWMRLSQLVPPV
jgi:hypothetical protein